MHLRKATLDDLKSVHEIESASFNEGSYPLFVLRQFLDISEDYFLVAVKDEKILGYVLGNLSHKLVQGWILSLGVHPEARGKQIGTALTEKLIALLENNNAMEISLTVHPNNTSAIRIYEALDFEIILESENYYLDNETRFLMKRKTAGNPINS